MNEGSETEATNELKQKEQRDSKETEKRREGRILWGRSQRLGARRQKGRKVGGGDDDVYYYNC